MAMIALAFGDLRRLSWPELQAFAGLTVAGRMPGKVHLCAEKATGSASEHPARYI
jgi:hypothetical protein